MIATAYVSHNVPGRLRLKIPEKKGEAAFFAKVANAVMEMPNMTSIQVNHVTASILCLHDDVSVQKISDYANEHRLFTIDTGGHEPVPVWQQASSGVATLDQTLKHISSGRIDLRSTLFVGVTALAIRQAYQGQILGPAATLLWYAMQLLKESKGIVAVDKGGR
jgi:hypothetical protein